MLGKLVKYEFKSTTRIMWFLFAGIVVVAALLGILIRVGIGDNPYDDFNISPDKNLVLSILITALGLIYVLLLNAVAIVTTVMIVLRFYRSLLGGEGYLMHTLPVKTSNLIWSKFIVAVVWMLIAGIAAVLSAIMLGLTSGILPQLLREITWDEFKKILEYVFSTNGLLFMLFCIVSVFESILTYYLSMAIGNLANKNKVLYSVLAYLGINIGLTIILSIVGNLGGSLFEILFTDLTFRSVIVPSILVQAALGIAAFIGTCYILKNKLNLA